MQRNPNPNLIIISGSGRNVGKSYMASSLIRWFSDQFPILGLKISPHGHNSLGNTKLCANTDGIRIFQDMGPNQKSSGKFLEAGALQSFFMETDDKHLVIAFDMFMKECNPMKYPVICESGALGRLIKPGILIFITDSAEDLQPHKSDTMKLADLVLPAKIFSPPEILQRINFAENGWSLSRD
jgi:hypothetical protein